MFALKRHSAEIEAKCCEAMQLEPNTFDANVLKVLFFLAFIKNWLVQMICLIRKLPCISISSGPKNIVIFQSYSPALPHTFSWKRVTVLKILPHIRCGPEQIPCLYSLYSNRIETERHITPIAPQNCRVCIQCGTRTSVQWHHTSLLCENCVQNQDPALSCSMCACILDPEHHKDLVFCQTCKR